MVTNQTGSLVLIAPAEAYDLPLFILGDVVIRNYFIAFDK